MPGMNDAADPDAHVRYWLEMAEARATREYVQAAIDAMPGNPLGLALRDIGGGVAVALEAREDPFFNRVIGLGIDRPASERDLEAAIGFYTEHDRTYVSISIAPQARPTHLVKWVTDRGFPVSRRWPKLWRSLETLPDPPPTDLRVEPIGPDRATDFARVVNAAFEFGEELEPMLPVTVGRPDWIHYLGYEGDAPVAAGAMYRIGDIAWFGFGATLASHRGRGGQSAIFHRRLADARSLGCRLAFTETGPDTPEEPNPSFHNMLRLGFQVGYHRPNYVRRPPGH